MFRCIHYLQCFDDCSPDLWETQRTVDVEKLRIDMTTFKCVLLPLQHHKMSHLPGPGLTPRHRAMGPLPACPKCHGLARPNGALRNKSHLSAIGCCDCLRPTPSLLTGAPGTVLMFGDYGWNEDRFEVQLEHYEAWMASLKEKKDTRLVVVEIGAGTVSQRTRTTAHTTQISYRTRRYGRADGAKAERAARNVVRGALREGLGRADADQPEGPPLSRHGALHPHSARRPRRPRTHPGRPPPTAIETPAPYQSVWYCSCAMNHMAWFVDVGLSPVDSSRVLCRQLQSATSTRLVVNEEGSPKNLSSNYSAWESHRTPTADEEEEDD